MFESEIYRPPMEYQYIVDDSQNGEFVFYPLFLVIENDEISTQSKGGVFVSFLLRKSKNIPQMVSVNW